MVSSKNARCAALLLLAVLLISCSGMASAARGLEETAPPVPEDDYPAEAPAEAPEQEQTPSFPEFEIPPFSEPAFPKVELPPMPEMPAIPGFHFSEPETVADEP